MNAELEELLNSVQEVEKPEPTPELNEIMGKFGSDLHNVAGVIVVNSDGVTVKSTLENSLSMQVSRVHFKLGTFCLI